MTFENHFLYIIFTEEDIELLINKTTCRNEDNKSLEQRTTFDVNNPK